MDITQSPRQPCTLCPTALISLPGSLAQSPWQHCTACPAALHSLPGSIDQSPGQHCTVSWAALHSRPSSIAVSQEALHSPPGSIADSPGALHSLCSSIAHIDAIDIFYSYSGATAQTLKDKLLAYIEFFNFKTRQIQQLNQSNLLLTTPYVCELLHSTFHSLPAVLHSLHSSTAQSPWQHCTISMAILHHLHGSSGQSSQQQWTVPMAALYI